MRSQVHNGRTFDAGSTVVSAGVYRGVFDVDSTSEDVDDGVINEATATTFSSREAAEEAADVAARKWIDEAASKT